MKTHNDPFSGVRHRVELTGLYERDENLKLSDILRHFVVELTGLYERDENL